MRWTKARETEEVSQAISAKEGAEAYANGIKSIENAEACYLKASAEGTKKAR